MLNEPLRYLYSAQLNITKETTPIKFGLYLLNFRLIFLFGLYFCINKPPIFNNMSYSGYTVMKSVFRDVLKIFCFFFLLGGSNLLLSSVFFCDFFWFPTTRGRQLWGSAAQIFNFWKSVPYLCAMCSAKFRKIRIQIPDLEQFLRSYEILFAILYTYISYYNLQQNISPGGGYHCVSGYTCHLCIGVSARKICKVVKKKIKSPDFFFIIPSCRPDFFQK